MPLSAWVTLVLGLGSGFVLGLSLSVWVAVVLWRTAKRYVDAKETEKAEAGESPVCASATWIADSRGLN